MLVSFIIQGAESPYSEELKDLKKSLEKQVGKRNVDLQHKYPRPGEMGGGITNILTAAIDKDNIAKVKTFIAKFTQLKKVEMTLVNAKGEKIELNAAMDKEVMYMLLNGFFERSLIEFTQPQPEQIEKPWPEKTDKPVKPKKKNTGSPKKKTTKKSPKPANKPKKKTTKQTKSAKNTKNTKNAKTVKAVK